MSDRDRLIELIQNAKTNEAFDMLTADIDTAIDMPHGEEYLADHLISLWREFCDEICDEGFKNVPTQTAFCRWLNHRYEKTDRKTIYNSLNKYFPEIKAEEKD